MEIPALRIQNGWTRIGIQVFDQFREVFNAENPNWKFFVFSSLSNYFDLPGSVYPTRILHT